MRVLVPTLLVFASLSFGLGIVLPLLSIDRLYVFTDEPSLVGIIAGLWTGGDMALAAIVALFSIVFPAAKLVLLNVWACAGRSAHDRIPEWFRGLSNWSMLDVVLVALVIFAAKTSGIATAFTRPGLWFFATSVLLTVVTSYILKKRNESEQYQ